MRILFITTLNLATNPRLFKEIKLALDNHFRVEVICFEFENWSYSFNQQLKQQVANAKFNIIPAGRKPFFPWAISVFWEKFYRTIGTFISLPLHLQSMGISRRSSLLVKTLKSINGHFDLVIGHNPGALYPTYYAANKFKAKAAFDVEDYHPGEGGNKKEQALTFNLMKELLPKMYYVSFAAPLIKNKHLQDCGVEGKNWITILNYFPQNDFVLGDKTKENGKLKLVWFSQNIDYKRGLEQIIPVLDKYKEKVQLTLIGNCKEAFASQYLSGRPHINVIHPLEQKELHKSMRNFDIGLAIEPGKDKNNFIALANKLITYFQAGLYILASDTPAHIAFFKEYSLHGKAVSLEMENISSVLDQLLMNMSGIRDGHE
ncbi:MAG: hypothetical protein IT255_11000, partial [Chitinophagaceae bacterium]|nr:hypothetical protein [Chitinophagaceae bacterium]